MSKTLIKYIAAFDYFDKFFLVLLAKSVSVPTAFFATVIGALVGITSPSLSLVFSISNGITKKLLKTIRKDKNNKFVLVATKTLEQL